MIYVIVYIVSFENIKYHYAETQWEASHGHRQKWDKLNEVHSLCE